MLTQLAALLLVVATQNVLRTMPPDQARHDIRHAAAHSSILVTQEMFTRRAARFRPAGWGSAHFPGPRGDCATYWQRRSWKAQRAWPVRVSRATFPHGSRWALVTLLRAQQSGQLLAVICVHLITHSLARRAVYGRSADRLRTLVARLRQRMPVVIGGDWNRVWRLRARFPGCASQRPPAGTGPSGGRVDYLLGCGLQPAGAHVIWHTYSDHNGLRASFR